MRRLRFFRVLVPVLLLPFLVILALQLQPKPSVHNDPSAAGTATAAGPSAESMNLVEFIGGRRSFSGDIGKVRQEPDGSLHLEDIQRLEMERKDAPPLILSAERANVEGAAGQRRFRLLGGVRVREEQEGLVVTLPELEVDQASGEARSVGAVHLESPDYRGKAGSVVYGLDDQPTRLFDVLLESEDGAVLRALRARLIDGTRDIEFQGDVLLTERSDMLAADGLRLWRWPGGGIRRVVASEQVSGVMHDDPGTLTRFGAEHVELERDERGEPTRLTLDGEALLVREPTSLAATRIEAVRLRGDAERWDVTATGAVYAEGTLGAERAVLRTQELQATLEPGGRLLEARAAGRVDFRSGETWADAAEAVLTPGAVEEVVLSAAPRRRARLARGQTRVTAERIATDVGGRHLAAWGKVEATLLPGGAAGGEPASGGLFRGDQAVHFVASRLDSREAGAELAFSGAVRGWQGERTLSADQVFIDETQRNLRAQGQVSTRIPRQAGVPAVAEADYIVVSAERLDYGEEARQAVYRGGARIRQDEGWLEAERVEVDLARQGRGVREVRAAGNVRLEFRPPQSDGGQPVSGEGDRAMFLPAERTVLLFGDDKPAAVRRAGEGGGTTTGRVLRYRLDTGTLQVESGDQDRVRIRTSGGGP